MALLLDEPAVHRRDDGVVFVAGPDRLTYLHSLLSQHFEDATPGTVADFLYLDAKGNALAVGRAVVHAERVVCVVPAAVAAEFADALDRFRFLMQVEVTDATGDWTVASVRGPGDVPDPGAPSRPMTAAPHGDGLVARDRSGGVDLVGPADWVTDKVAGLGLPEASKADWEAWRIREGIPGWGAEIVPGRRPHDLGLLPTHVHLRKGCYPGQEVIAKVHNLGRPRRALAVIEADATVTPGAAVTGGPKPGEVTSAAGSYALALLPLDRVGALPDVPWAIDDTPARILKRVGEGLAQPGA